ncbi:hypothetical protein NECID01_1793 [Nematocida sp. AWRm77]|nr:hypothetical protein NECID01_1793 [Nematocida sp. AWRm77]
MSEKKFAAALEKQLELFRTATEWSDFVAYLTGLESILKMHKFSDIPKPCLLYRRLSQCLNPALPAGVHTKALSVYKIVISRIKKESLEKNVQILCLGLFSFYSHANLAVVPNYFEVIKLVIMHLREASKNVCRQIVSSVVMGLEEENSDAYGLSIELFRLLEETVGRSLVVQTVWEVMVQGTEFVPGGIVYLGRTVIPEKSTPSLRASISRGFVSAFRSKEIVTLRKAFDMLMQYKTEGMDFGEYEDSITLSVLQFLHLKEISLFKRVQQWVGLVLSAEKGVERLFSILCQMYKASPSMYFKILTAMHQGMQEVQAVFGPCIQWILQNVDKTTETSALAFFAILNRRLVWSTLKKLPVSETSVIDKEIQYGLVDKHAQTEELPEIITAYFAQGQLPLKWLSVVCPTEEKHADMCKSVIERLGTCTVEEGVKTVHAFINMSAKESEDSPRMPSQALETSFLGVFDRAWSTPGLGSTLHCVIISSLEAMGRTNKEFLGKIDTEKICRGIEEPYLFWRYNSVLERKLQSTLMHQIVYRREQFREYLEESPELFKAFFLLENIPAEEDMSSKMEFVCFLLSLHTYGAHAVSARACSFASRLVHFQELFKEVLRRLNCTDTCVRVSEGHGIQVVDLDHNRVLEGVQLLQCLVQNSQGFVQFLKREDSLVLMEELMGSSDVIEYVTGTKDVSPFLSLFSLLMLHICVKDASYRISAVSTHRKRIESLAVAGVLLLLRKDVAPARARVQVNPELLPLFLSSDTAGAELHMKLEILEHLSNEQYFGAVKQLYLQNREARESVLQFLILHKKTPVLLQIFSAACRLLCDKEISELSRIEHMAQHILGVRHSETQQISASLFGNALCTCGCPIQASTMEEAVSHVISQLFSVYTAFYAQKRVFVPESAGESEEAALEKLGTLSVADRPKKTREQACEGEASVDVPSVQEKIKQYLQSAYGKNTHLFAEIMIRQHAQHKSIVYTDAVSENVAEVFSSVLRVTSFPSETKYSMLQEWLGFIEKPSEIENEKTFGTMGMILSQSKNRLEDIPALEFFSMFFSVASAKESLEIGLRALDVCAVLGGKVGNKKPLDGKDAAEKTAVLHKLIKVAENFVHLAAIKKVSIDILSVWTTLAFPYLKQSVYPELYESALSLAFYMSGLPDNNRYWKKDFYDFSLSEKFFKDSLDNIRKKMKIMSAVIEPDKMADLIYRASTAGFFIRDSDIIGRASAIKRLRLMVLCAPFGEYTQELSSILGLVSEVFSTPGTAKILVAETYSLCRALCVKMPPSFLANLWSVVVSEAVAALDADSKQHFTTSFSALRFLDLVASLAHPETLEFRWMVENMGSSSQSKDFLHASTALPISAQASKASKRVPCIINSADWANESISVQIEKVSAHHKAQMFLSDIGHREVFESLIDDIPEKS